MNTRAINVQVFYIVALRHLFEVCARVVAFSVCYCCLAPPIFYPTLPYHTTVSQFCRVCAVPRPHSTQQKHRNK